jgi:hypothetical protein
VQCSPRATSYRHHYPYYLIVPMLLALAFVGCGKMEPEGTVPERMATEPPPAPAAAPPPPPPAAVKQPEEASPREEQEARREAMEIRGRARAQAERASRVEELARAKQAERAPSKSEAREAKAPLPRAVPSPTKASRPAPTALPDFPWPPPEPSARTELPNSLFTTSGKASPSLASVGAQLVGALEQAHYFEYSYYRAPGGFALVARLERMASDGTPLPEEFRFLQPGSQEPFSLAVYVKRLFFAPEGFYRQIVFVASDQPFAATGARIDAKAAAQLLSSGANRLSGDYETLPFTPEHRVSALIYEYRKGAGEGDVSTLTPGRLGARTHLDRAGIYPALEKPGR